MRFVHTCGRFVDYEMPQIMGSGCALVDYDGDGRLDLYFVNGAPSPSTRNAAADRGDGFFRQTVGGRFENVMSLSRVSANEYGMGAWWGDFDGDGFPDLFLTSVGRNRLFHNHGDGTFGEVPLPPGVVDRAWSTAACWSDINGDGHLDLFVVNYVDYVPGQYCEGPDGRRDFCGPTDYHGTVDRVLINTGGLDAQGIAFADETVRRGLGGLRGKGLGTVACDFNGDGRIDLYVANDMQANRLWIQQPDGTFQNRAEILGVARNALGEAEASMGVVVGDWNGDGRPDLFMTHLAGETNTLYLSDGHGFWNDATASSRLGPPSLSFTGFGVGTVDLDQDGEVDFLIANGGVKRDSSEKSPDPLRPYAQPNAIFLRDGDRVSFREANRFAGEFAGRREISRALAVGDLDRDGACDVVLANCEGRARIYRNVVPNRGHWLALKLVDVAGHRDAVGARVRVTAGKRRVERYVNPCQGYLTQNDSWLHYGLGKQARFDSIEVFWPDGHHEKFSAGAADRRLILVRGRQQMLDLTGGVP